MTPRRARVLAVRWLIAGTAATALWTPMCAVPDDADDWLLVTSGLTRGPLFAAAALCLLNASRLDGWRAGHRAAQLQTAPEENQ